MKKSDAVPAMLTSGEFVCSKNEPVVAPKKTRLEIGFWSSFSAHCLYKDLVKECLKNSKKDEEPS